MKCFKNIEKKDVQSIYTAFPKRNHGVGMDSLATPIKFFVKHSGQYPPRPVFFLQCDYKHEENLISIEFCPVLCFLFTWTGIHGRGCLIYEFGETGTFTGI